MGRAYDWSLYGPTGVTGRIILEAALARGHRPRLLGRPSAQLRKLAAETGLPWREAVLDDVAGLDGALIETSLVVHAAGPFVKTGQPLLAAALRTRTHYVDVNGEPDFLDALLAEDRSAKDAGITLVGAAGFGVTAADCLALYVAQKLAVPSWVRVAIAADTARTSLAAGETRREVIGGGGRRIVSGERVRRPLADVRWREVDQKGKAIHFAAAPMAELTAVARTTGARNVTVGVPMTPAASFLLRLFSPVLPTILRLQSKRSRKAPTPPQNAPIDAKAAYASRVWAAAGDGEGQTAAALLTAGEGYAFAGESAVSAVEAVLAGAPPGAWTPAAAFGAAFLSRLPGVSIMDLPAPSKNQRRKAF